MSRVIYVGVAASLLIHGGFFFGGQLLKARTVPVPVAEAKPTVELIPLPPIEPESPPAEAEVAPAEASLSDVALPTQADTPSIIASAFEQQIQPPAPPGARPTGVISIPSGGIAKASLQNLFDIGSLDQRPEPRFQPPPNYPDALRRRGVTGEVSVGFIVDDSGNTRDAYIIRSTRNDFESAVLQAVAKWKFTPGKKNGATVNTRVTIQIPFNLEKD